jgi:hypothetical protein
MSKANVYRARAAACQRQAEEAVTAKVRDVLCEIAETYVMLAITEERKQSEVQCEAHG